MSNQGFLNNAPSEVVENEKVRQEEYRTTLEKLEESLAVLS